CLEDLREEQEPSEDSSSPPAQSSVNADKKFRDLKRAVVEAQSLIELDTGVSGLLDIPHPGIRMDVRLSPCSDEVVTVLVVDAHTRAFSWNLVSGHRNAELDNFSSCDADHLAFTED